MSTPTFPVQAYPVRVDATLDEGLSRWLWLVKWLLVLPHVVVLALLWASFFVLSVLAFVSILVTSHYPRAIFDFNVGVLRWTWRVGYYAYGGLGTDHYPPFSLREDPAYPAHLEVEYPAHLSRGLVLVKWWLLAIPHYLVVGIFLGAGWYVATSADGADVGNLGGGLIDVLVLVAAVVLLVTGTYPRPVFDLVLGLNRWVLRVAAYAGLMTDTYPPFRLDQGGQDPGTELIASRAADLPAPVPTTTAPASVTSGAGRATAVVIGSLVGLVSLGLLAGSAAAQVANSALRDDDGYLMTSAVALESPGYAVTSESAELRAGTGVVAVPERWVGTVKVRADAQTANGVFVGIASSDDVEAYLAGVARSVVLGASEDGAVDLRFTDGGSPRVAPQDADFWVASARGSGAQELTWASRAGDWTVVVMNGEGTTPVAAEVAVGATAPILDEVAVGLLVGGLLMGALAVGLLYAGLARRGRTAAP